MGDQGEQFRVSPVKATAVMVAVAVVGGILVFAASQWFFGQPAPEPALAITGYDATGDCLQDHAGAPVLPCEPSEGGLAAGDLLAIYVHNAGPEQLQVSLIEIAGVVHFPGEPGSAGNFAPLGDSAIAAGGDGTIIVRYAGADQNSGSVVDVIVEASEVATAQIIVGERAS